MVIDYFKMLHQLPGTEEYYENLQIAASTTDRESSPALSNTKQS
jgi:hypothetical protein